MATKKQLMKLSYPHMNPNSQTDHLYRVEQITNSIEYTPGMTLHKDEVRSLCASRSWDVVLVPRRD